MDSKMKMFETVLTTISSLFYESDNYYPLTRITSSQDFKNYIESDMTTTEIGRCAVYILSDPLDSETPWPIYTFYPATVVYFTHNEKTFVALLCVRYAEFFHGEVNRIYHNSWLVDVRNATAETFREEYINALSQKVEVFLPIGMGGLYLSPDRFRLGNWGLPPKEGMKAVRVNDLIEKVELSYDESDGYAKILDNKYGEDSAFKNLLTAQHSKVKKVSGSYTLKQSGLVMMYGNPFYFDDIAGECSVEYSPYFWRVRTEKVIPQYLLMQLYEDYVVKQYKDEYERLRFSNDPFQGTYIYLPDGDDELSLYEQQRLYNEYRANEIQKLFVASGINIDMDGTLPHGSILQHGKYIIEDKIDNGGFGITYKATAKKISGRQSVVLKELFVKGFCTRKPLTNEVVCPDVNAKEFDRQKDKFVKEHEILVKLADKTKFVPSVGETAFEENNTLYYEMQYVENGTLWSHRQRKDLTVQDILRIICHAGIALHCAHEMEFLHLDVTPLNIMVDDYNNGVLIDFGNSKHYSTQDEKFTTSGQVAKTNAFAPPELLTQQHDKFCMATDVYGLAITLYCMLTNDRFSTRCESDDVYLKHIKMKMEECEVTTPVADAIIKALHFDPKERQESVRAFLTELSAALDDTDLKAKIRELSVLPDFSFSDSIDVAVDNSVESEMDDDFI